MMVNTLLIKTNTSNSRRDLNRKKKIRNGCTLCKNPNSNPLKQSHKHTRQKIWDYLQKCEYYVPAKLTTQDKLEPYSKY